MLDVIHANRFSMFFVGKTRNERLADHYLAKSGIAGIWIDDKTGDTGALNVVTIDRLEGRSIYCCQRFSEALILARDTCLYREISLLHRAGLRGIGVTPHEVVVARAMAAVETVNARIAAAQLNGAMRQINRKFKEARKADPGLRYHDFLHGHKETLLEAMAWEMGQP